MSVVLAEIATELEGAEAPAFEALLRAVRDELHEEEADALGTAYRQRLRAISDKLHEDIQKS